MSVQGIGALERGDRRTPQRETLLLLIEALELGSEQRAAFEAAALRENAPRLGPADVVSLPHHSAPADVLPISLTSFVGREIEVGEICALVVEHRLVTLTGPGGIGKTRTAVDASRVLLEQYPDAVRFVELALVRDAALVINAIGASLNLGESPSRNAFEALVAHLEQRRVLLVIDNCEHVIAEVARSVERLLRMCPQLRVLATSRESLRIPGERVYRLPSLQMPAAIRLFAERAFAVDRAFVLDDRSAPIVAEICAQLDGMPLAIELAAARVTALSLPALAANLRRQLTLLGVGTRTADSRQQTMRAAIDWSFDLLDESERRLFTALAVFAGGWTIDAAVAVAGVSDDRDPAHSGVLDVLSSLVDKSLVVADLGLAIPRYRMLEPFRQYAREKLVDSGELEIVSRRHAAAFLKIAEDFTQEVGVSAQGDAYAAARLDLDNWRAALEWCLVARNDVRTGQLIASNLRMVWGTFATFEGRRWTRLALEAGGSETPVEVAARLERMDATLCWKLGDYKGALAAATRALAHQSLLGDEVEIARAELEVGNSLLLLGRAGEAEDVLRRALAKAERNGADRLASKILYLLGETLAAIGDFTAARAACAKAFTLFRDAKGDRRIVGLVTRAEIEFQAGDVAAALRLNEEAFREIPSLGENENAQVLESALHANAAAYLISLDRYDEARTYARTALETAARLRFPPEKLWALLHLAAISVLEPQAHGNDRAIEAVERAARLIGFVSNRYDERGGALGPTERREFERVLGALGVELPPDRISSLRANGAAMSDDEAVAEAMHV